MDGKKLNFKIVTPAAIEYEGDIDSVTLQTEAGEITVLPGHVGLVSLLRAGALTIRRDGAEKIVRMRRGVLEVIADNHATVIGEVETD